MNTQTQLDLAQELWGDLDLTRLLEEHVPVPRRYLVDRLLRLIFTPEIEGDSCSLELAALDALTEEA